MKIKKEIFIIFLIFLFIGCNNRNVNFYIQQIFEPDHGPIYIPAGEFIMGSDSGKPNESPAHIVYLDSYYIDENLVTNEEYLKFWEDPKGGNKYYFTPQSFTNNSWPQRASRKPRHPVIGISWSMASKYAEWAGKRLPTEAEWEKAAKGVTQRKYPWGDTPPDYADKFRANFYIVDLQSEFPEDGFSSTSPVGYYNGINLKTAEGRSPYELNDMAGNVWEWVRDWYSPDYYKYSPYENPKGPGYDYSDGTKVIRGGSWKNSSEELVTTFRMQKPFEYRENDIGFRCAKSAQ